MDVESKRVDTTLRSEKLYWLQKLSGKNGNSYTLLGGGSLAGSPPEKINIKLTLPDHLHKGLIALTEGSPFLLYTDRKSVV